MTEARPELTRDCAACAALCCVGLDLDAGEDFAIDKPAGQPCPHLDRHACTIYSALKDKGFRGCTQFDCDGAGQRTLTLYGGQSWRDAPSALRPMLETFRALRTLHGLIALLVTASRLPLDPKERARHRDLLIALCPKDMTASTADALANGPLPGEVKTFLRSLAHHL